MRGSIRRPLTIYSLVCTLGCALGVVTFASFSMIDLVRPGRPPTSEGPYVTGAADPAVRRLPRTITVLLLVGVGTAAVTGLFLSTISARLVLAPLNDLARTVETVSEDPLSVDVAGGAADEIQALSRAFRRSLRRVREEQAAIEAGSRELAAAEMRLAHADKLASIGRVAAGVAHEIGNPLAAVLGYLRVLQRIDEADERTVVINRSIRELGRIHATITDLLAYARTGVPEARTTTAFDLRSAVHDRIGLLRAHPALAEVALSFEDASGGPVAALGDVNGISDVLTSLVVNAAQAVEGRADRRVMVRVDDTGGEAVLRVDDSGPGIPPEHRAQIFEPFFTTKRAGKGTGLGLALARATVEGMGGRIELSDSPLGGMTFLVSLPARPSRDETG